MQLSKITDSNACFKLSALNIYCKPIVALTLPPGMLAIAEALNIVLEHLKEDPDNKVFDPWNADYSIEIFKEENGWWDVTIAVTDELYSRVRKTVFDVSVVRDINDYNASITSIEVVSTK